MGRPAGPAAWLLLAANLILLGVVWAVSLNAYGQLPPQIASWSSVWTGQPLRVERSGAFFLYPVCQVLFFVIGLGLAEIFVIRAPRPGIQGRVPDAESAGRIRNLREEVLYLALIFFNLMFIHLQTSRILFSREIGAGINRAYFSGLVLMVIFILLPYYRLRRRIILAEKGGSSGPR